MINVKFYLDFRSNPKIGSLKIAVIYKSKACYFLTGIKLKKNQFDSKKNQIKNIENKDSLNSLILQKKSNIENLVSSYIFNNIEFKDINELKTKISTDLDINKSVDNNEDFFCDIFKRFVSLKNKNKTISIYNLTLKRLSDFDPNIKIRKFEDIKISYLLQFENYLSLTSNSKNGRNVHLRNIRAVFNYAIDENITTFYPFRKFKIRPVETLKRSLNVNELRTLFNYNCFNFQRKYIDIFKLSFFLIGINIIDLLNLKEINNSRIEFYRSKTNKLYSIKVEPEALEIINKYSGKNYLLNILDNIKNHTDFLKRFNKTLKTIGETKIIEHNKKEIQPLFPKLTSYWARHTWASIASELDIPKETISQALGHTSNTVTDIYIKFNRDKVDNANRKVINFVLYNII